MITIERTVFADRPFPQVFAYLTDFTNAEEWDTGTVSCTLISGDGGVGTRYRNVSKFLGRETELIYVAKQVEPGKPFVVQGKNETVTSTDTVTMRSQEVGTEVTYKAEFEFSGAARFLEPVLRLPLKRLGDKAETTLREALSRL